MLNNSCCNTSFKVEAVVSVDDRGQLLLPKDLREKIGLKPGAKLAVATMERDGEFCCMCMVKSDDLSGLVKDLLGPMMQEINTR